MGGYLVASLSADALHTWRVLCFLIVVFGHPTTIDCLRTAGAADGLAHCLTRSVHGHLLSLGLAIPVHCFKVSSRMLI